MFVQCGARERNLVNGAEVRVQHQAGDGGGAAQVHLGIVPAEAAGEAGEGPGLVGHGDPRRLVLHDQVRKHVRRQARHACPARLALALFGRDQAVAAAAPAVASVPDAGPRRPERRGGGGAAAGGEHGARRARRGPPGACPVEGAAAEEGGRERAGREIEAAGRGTGPVLAPRQRIPEVHPEAAQRQCEHQVKVRRVIVQWFRPCWRGNGRGGRLGCDKETRGMWGGAKNTPRLSIPAFAFMRRIWGGRVLGPRMAFRARRTQSSDPRASISALSTLVTPLPASRSIAAAAETRAEDCTDAPSSLCALAPDPPPPPPSDMGDGRRARPTVAGARTCCEESRSHGNKKKK
jgi:hypothetical protein